MTRLLFAFLAGPFWTAVFLGLQARLFWREPEFISPGEQPDWVLMATLLGLLAGAVAMAVLGLPAHRLLRRRGRTALTPYLLAFTAIGLAGWCAALLIASAFGPADLRFALYMLADTVVSRPVVPLSAAALGALVGASFWAIARPDTTHLPLDPSAPRPGGPA